MFSQWNNYISKYQVECLPVHVFLARDVTHHKRCANSQNVQLHLLTICKDLCILTLHSRDAIQRQKHHHHKSLNHLIRSLHIDPSSAGTSFWFHRWRSHASIATLWRPLLRKVRLHSVETVQFWEGHLYLCSFPSPRLALSTSKCAGVPHAQLLAFWAMLMVTSW